MHTPIHLKATVSEDSVFISASAMERKSNNVVSSVVVIALLIDHVLLVLWALLFVRLIHVAID